MNPRTLINYVWSVVVLAIIGIAAYFLLPIIGNWMSEGMGQRDTFDRPTALEQRDNLPSK
jgi:type II secretory pathway pseudopilin PulG